MHFFHNKINFIIMKKIQKNKKPKKIFIYISGIKISSLLLDRYLSDKISANKFINLNVI